MGGDASSVGRAPGRRDNDRGADGVAGKSGASAADADAFKSTMDDVAKRATNAVVGTAKLTGGIAVGALERVGETVEGAASLVWEGAKTVNDAAGTVLDAGLSPLGIDAFQGHAERNAARGQAILDGIKAAPELPGKLAQSVKQSWNRFEHNWDTGNYYDVGRQMGSLGVDAAGGAVVASKAAPLVKGLSSAEKGLGSAENIYSGMRPLADEFPELSGVNPHYAAGARNTNCVSCANATTQRLSGADPSAVAGKSAGYGNPNDLLPSAPFGFQSATTPALAEQQMLKAGDGALGVVRIEQASGVEHVVNVVNKGGTVYFVDSQSGHIVTLRPDLTVRLGTRD